MSKIAAIQMASGPSVGSNLLEAGRLIERAVSAGAQAVVLPENFAIMGLRQSDMVAEREVDGQGPIQDFLAQQARKHRLWVVGGSVPIDADSEERVRQACLVYDERGERVARYDKIHLFDVKIEESGEQYTESRAIEPGAAVVSVATPFGRLGLTVCYDLRFPELFRALVDQGVEWFVVPSAFTRVTGQAHWEPLLRARAIENLSYVVAAAQGGYHLNGRETYGHSMIVDPWGRVLDCLANGSGFVIADLDRARLLKTRQSFPSLEHRRLSCALDADQGV